jgi:hypothetical protein
MVDRTPAATVKTAAGACQPAVPAAPGKDEASRCSDHKRQLPNPTYRPAISFSGMARGTDHNAMARTFLPDARPYPNERSRRAGAAVTASP